MVSAWNGYAWRHAFDPQPLATGTGGSPWSRLGDKLAKELKLPIGFISVGIGGSRVLFWTRAANFKRITDAIEATKPNGFRAILWHQGESDAIAKTSAKKYAEMLTDIIKRSRKYAGWNVPWFVAIAAYHPRTKKPEETEICNGQLLTIKQNDNVFIGPNTDNYPKTKETLADRVHFNAKGLGMHSDDWLKILSKYIAEEHK